MQISKRKNKNYRAELKKISFGIFLSIRTDYYLHLKVKTKKLVKKNKPRNKDINPICDIIFNSPVTY